MTNWEHVASIPKPQSLGYIQSKTKCYNELPAQARSSRCPQSDPSACIEVSWVWVPSPHLRALVYKHMVAGT